MEWSTRLPQDVQSVILRFQTQKAGDSLFPDPFEKIGLGTRLSWRRSSKACHMHVPRYQVEEHQEKLVAPSALNIIT